jgi:septal ring factor EnvC (AmiA/AmiB activator)
MTNNLGELKLGKALLAILLGCALAWFVYSRFSFEQETGAADKTTALLERELKEAKDEAAALRKRIEEIERRLSEPTPPAVRKAKPQPKAGKGK